MNSTTCCGARPTQRSSLLRASKSIPAKIGSSRKTLPQVLNFAVLELLSYRECVSANDFVNGPGDQHRDETASMSKCFRGHKRQLPLHMKSYHFSIYYEAAHYIQVKPKYGICRQESLW
jgi:hypothetical protein